MPKSPPQTIINPGADSGISKNYSNNFQNIPIIGDNAKIYITDVFQSVTTVVNNFTTDVGGANGDVQLNIGGKLSGDSGMRYNANTDTLTVTGNVIAGNVRTDHIFYSNGVAWSTGIANANNITITGNVIAGNVRTDHIFYSNGVAWSTGGVANTGNITFNGDQIQSTNEIVNISANDYAQLQSHDTYIWAENGSADIRVNNKTWVFNSQGYMSIPNDGSFGALNSEILAFSSQNNKPIFIEVIDTGNSRAHQWVFDNDGVLTLPSDTFGSPNYSVIQSSGSSDIDIYTGDGNAEIWLEANGNVLINTMGATNTWKFDGDGNLRLPGNTILQGDGGGIEYPVNGEWDLHRADGKVYIGSTTDTAYIDTYDVGINVRLRTSNNSAQNDWIFSSDGNLTLPGNTFSINFANGHPASSAVQFNGGNVSGETIFSYNQDSTNTTTGAVRITHGMSVGANLHAGELHVLGNTTVGGPVLYVGSGAEYQSLTNPTLMIFHSGESYIQAAIKNSIGDGSADWVAYSDYSAPDGSNGWADFGMTGSTFNDPNYTITGPGDGYFFVQARQNPTQGGNLVIATGNEGQHNDIVFATGGFDANNEIMRVNAQSNTFYVGRTVLSGTNVINLEVNGNAKVGGELTIKNHNGHGGSGYAGMLTLENDNNTATKGKKFIRINNVGQLEIIDDGYTSTIFSLDDNGNTYIKGHTTFGDFLKLTPSGAPSSPTEGMVYYDSTAHKLKVYTGSGWETISSAP